MVSRDCGMYPADAVVGVKQSLIPDNGSSLRCKGWFLRLWMAMEKKQWSASAVKLVLVHPGRPRSDLGFWMEEAYMAQQTFASGGP
jgi:hypothetical protein